MRRSLDHMTSFPLHFYMHFLMTKPCEQDRDRDEQLNRTATNHQDSDHQKTQLSHIY